MTNIEKIEFDGSSFRKQEAFTRMHSGEKVTHKSMMPNEYLHIPDGSSKVLTEDGFDFTESFWFRNIPYYEYGWSQYCPQPTDTR